MKHMTMLMALIQVTPLGNEVPWEWNAGKHSDTRIQPLLLTNGHGRYMTVTPEPERALVSVGG
jgi:hypothetical protein